MVTMDTVEMDAWMRMLGPTVESRIAVIQDLIRHHRDDHMSLNDLDICREALNRLYAQQERRDAV